MSNGLFDAWKPHHVICVIILLMTLTGLICSTHSYYSGYFDGQVDAHHGALKYELQKQKDSSVRWVKTKE